MGGVRVFEHKHLHHGAQAGLAQTEVPGWRAHGSGLPNIPLCGPGHGRCAFLRPVRRPARLRPNLPSQHSLPCWLLSVWLMTEHLPDGLHVSGSPQRTCLACQLQYQPSEQICCPSCGCWSICLKACSAKAQCRWSTQPAQQACLSC